MSATFIDVSEFIKSPVRTGIQRVVREILAHWPQDRELVAVEYDPASEEMIRVDPAALAFARSLDRTESLGLAALNARMAQRRLEGPHPIIGDRPVIVPELFFDEPHCRYYRERPVRAAFVVYDFLPWLHPDLLGFSGSAPLNGYLLNVMRAERRCFISEPVRDDFFARIRRAEPPHDRAVTLGADGLGLRRGAGLEAAGDHLLCFGFLDGRKKQQVVLEAFLGSEAARRFKLIFAGRVPETPPAAIRPVLECDHPGVSVVRDPSDADLAELVRTARAVLFVSDAEGYGLPPVEALFAGTPVVVNAALPALAGLGDAGQIRIDDSGVEEVRAALDRLCDDREAARLRQATRVLKLATWAEYGADVARWAGA